MKALVDTLGCNYIVDYGYPNDPFIWVYVDKTDRRVFMQIGSELIGIK